MRKFLIAVAVLIALVIVAVVLAASLIDPNNYREPLANRLSAQLERKVEIGELDLALFPLPALRVQSVRIAGSKPSVPPLLDVDVVQVRLSLLPLLFGQVVLSSLEIDAPRIHVELDPEGRPILPGVKPPEAKPKGAKKPEPSSQQAKEAQGGPRLAVQNIRISEGRLQAGAWLAQNLSLSGQFSADGSAQFDLEADLPELALLRNARIDASGLTGGPLGVKTAGDLEQVKLAGLKKRLQLDPELSGQLAGPFRATLQDGTLTAGRIELSGAKIRLKQDDFTLDGGIKLVAELAKNYRIDLTQSQLVYGEIFEKPVGVLGVVSGALGSELDARMLRTATIHLAHDKFALLAMAFELAKKPARVRLEPGSVELAPLAPLLKTGLRSLAGRAEIEEWSVDLKPLALTGRMKLHDVVLGLKRGDVRLSGPVIGQGATLRADPLKVVIGDQTINLALALLEDGRVEVKGQTKDADVESLGRTLAQSSNLAGKLDGNVDVRGLPELPKLSGTGRFDIRDGRIRGFSLFKQVLGDFAAVPLLVAAMKGKDLSRFEEEEFRRLSADVQLSKGKLLTENLQLEYRHSTAHLRGSVGLEDGALDMKGRVMISEDVDAALAGQETGKEKVIPIAGVGGTVDKPKIRMDANALASLAATYVTHGRARKKLEEKIGKEGAKAVEDALDSILGGQGGGGGGR